MNQSVFADLVIGHLESLVVDISQKDVDAFIALCGDASTVHVDDEYARSRGFKQRLVHGLLVASFISNLIGMKLPGMHGVLRTISCEYRKPCYAPTRLTLTGRVDSLVPSLRIAGLVVEVRDQSNDVIVVARAQVVLKL